MAHPIELLPTAAAAAQLGVAPNTLAKWRQRGTGPAYRKIGARALYPASELAAFVAAQPLRRSTSELAASDTAPPAPVAIPAERTRRRTD